MERKEQETSELQNLFGQYGAFVPSVPGQDSKAVKEKVAT